MFNVIRPNRGHHPIRRWNVGRTEKLFGNVLVHSGGASEMPRAGVGYAGQVKKCLKRSVLSRAAMKSEENHIDVFEAG